MAGNFVYIAHPDGRATQYLHMDSVSSINNKSNIDEGEEIGLSGNTGYSFGSHVHYDVKDKEGNKVDGLEEQWQN